jgi:hypothetical protein
MNEMLTWVCCVCWLLPLALFGAAVTVASGVAQAWRTRGLEQGVIYCRRCRFDLRGAMNDRCSECGATLAGHNLLTPGMPPPANLFVRLALFLLAGAAPTVLGLVLLGSVLPFNYSEYRDMQLTATVFHDSQWLQADIDLYAQSDVGFFGSSEADEIHVESSDTLRQLAIERYSSLYGQPVWVDWRDEDAVGKQWDRVVELAPAITGDADPDDVRDEFIELAQAFGEGDESVSQISGDYFFVTGNAYQTQETHPAYVLFSIVAFIAVMVGLIVLAVRNQAKADDEYQSRYEHVQRRFDRMVASSRKAVLGGDASEHEA